MAKEYDPVENPLKKRTYRSELVREESPRDLWDLDHAAQNLRENPYKTPPNNLTTKQ